MTMLGTSRRGGGPPTGPTPSPVRGSRDDFFCDAETQPEPPHKDRWHGGITEKRLDTINNYSVSLLLPRTHARSSPAPPPHHPKKNKSRLRWRRRWRQVAAEHQGPSSTQTNAPRCQLILHMQTAAAERYIFTGSPPTPHRGGTICRLRYQTFNHL